MQVSCFVLLCLFLATGNVLSAQYTAINGCNLREHVFRAEVRPPSPFCGQEIAQLRNAIYLLYDVNPSEGFNLRRDVYVRLAVFVRALRQKRLFKNVRLVLPPWRRLYHWKSNHLVQDNQPWSAFFNIDSMRRYAPILDFPEFIEEIGHFGLQESPLIPVHRTFQLIHFDDMFENGVFRDKFEYASDCHKDNYLFGYLLQQSILLDNEFDCLRFQGSVNLLEQVLRQTLKHMPEDSVKVFAILNAEIVLHERWGDQEFWRARRSMRFANHLIEIANDFRLTRFNSSNASDKVQRPELWELERPYRSAKGGNYLCAHLRRGDFVHGREKTTPTLNSAASQIKQKLQELNLTTIFLATDANAFEVKNLRSHLQRYRVVRFSTESLQQKAFIKDGGIACIDQIICSHARHFIGTYESTFTYRIYEEREIRGFPKFTTFNTFCKSDTFKDCAKNSMWTIVY